MTVCGSGWRSCRLMDSVCVNVLGMFLQALGRLSVRWLFGMTRIPLRSRVPIKVSALKSNCFGHFPNKTFKVSIIRLFVVTGCDLLEKYVSRPVGPVQGLVLIHSINTAKGRASLIIPICPPPKRKTFNHCLLYHATSFYWQTQTAPVGLCSKDTVLL